VVHHLVHECPQSVETVELPDAGHWLHAEKPRELFDLLAPSFRKDE
jgi:pimeloyl-ACP methyl ester carboxylesterase